jgi:hypothetical protein
MFKTSRITEVRRVKSLPQESHPRQSPKAVVFKSQHWLLLLALEVEHPRPIPTQAVLRIQHIWTHAHRVAKTPNVTLPAAWIEPWTEVPGVWDRTCVTTGRWTTVPSAKYGRTQLKLAKIEERNKNRK